VNDYTQQLFAYNRNTWHHYAVAWLYRRDKIWWIGWRVNGKSHFRSTKETSKKTAQAHLDRLKFLEQAAHEARLNDAIIESLTARKAPQHTLQEATDTWLAECRMATQKGTLKAYKLVIDRFLKAIGATVTGPALRDITPEEIRMFQSRVYRESSAGNANKHLRVLKAFFAWALKNDFVRSNPVLPVRPIKRTQEERQQRRAFTLAEVQTIYSKAPDDFWRFMVIAGLYTGQRLGDLICLRWENVDFAADVLRLHQRKTGQSIIVPIAPRLRAILEELRALKPKTAGYIWPKEVKEFLRHGTALFTNRFYPILLKSGVAGTKRNGLGFHCMRRTFVSMLKLSGSSQSVAKQLAGHTTSGMSDLYTDVSDQAMRDAIDQLPKLEGAK